MSTLALWLFVALGLLLVAMIALVALAGRSVVRRAKALSAEMDGLQRDLDTTVESVARRQSDAPAHRARQR